MEKKVFDLVTDYIGKMVVATDVYKIPWSVEFGQLGYNNSKVIVFRQVVARLDSYIVNDLIATGMSELDVGKVLKEYNGELFNDYNVSVIMDNWRNGQ